MKRFAATFLLVIPTLLLGAEAPPEGTSIPGTAPNVAVTLFVGKSGGPGGADEKVYRLLGQAGSPARMLMGWRAPIPTRQSAADASDAPAMSFVYQNVGVSADLETDVLPDRRIRVRGQIEISGPRGAQLGELTSTKPTLIGTFQQALSVVLTPGKKLRIAQAPDPDGGIVHLDLQVDLVE
jgi:hypothetical protein